MIQRVSYALGAFGSTDTFYVTLSTYFYGIRDKPDVRRERYRKANAKMIAKQLQALVVGIRLVEIIFDLFDWWHHR